MAFITYVAFVVVIIALLRMSFIFRHKYKTDRSLSEPGLPFIGSFVWIRPSHIHKTMYTYAVKHGEIFKAELFRTDTVVLNSVSIIYKAFLKDGYTFNTRPWLLVGDRLGLTDSISFRDIDIRHVLMRRIFSKTLHLCVDTQNEFKQNTSAELQNMLEKMKSHGEIELEITDLVQKSVINIMSLLLIGDKATDQDIRSFKELISGEDFFLSASTNTLLSHFPFLLNLPYYRRKMDKVLLAKQILQEKYFYNVKGGNSLKSHWTMTKVRCAHLCLGESIIESNQANRNWANERTRYLSKKEKEMISGGFVKELLKETERKSQLSEETTKAIIVTDILTAGVLSTSNVLANIMLCLVNHPEYQLKVHQELERVVGSSRQPTIDDRHKCCFTEAVIMETMRLIPPSSFWLPHACKMDVELEGFKIKAGSQIFANAWFILHDGNIWGDSWTFRPERFIDEDGKILPSDHIVMKNWIPFGVGRRRCPGKEFAVSRLFLYIATIFQKYSLTPVSGKCGSCDPRSNDFNIDQHIKPKPFYCHAHVRTH